MLSISALLSLSLSLAHFFSHRYDEFVTKSRHFRGVHSIIIIITISCAREKREASLMRCEREEEEE